MEIRRTSTVRGRHGDPTDINSKRQAWRSDGDHKTRAGTGIRHTVQGRHQRQAPTAGTNGRHQWQAPPVQGRQEDEEISGRRGPGW